MMKKWGILGSLVAGLAMQTALAASLPGGYFNKQSVIAGAKLFAQHCSACHEVSSLRYSRLTTDLGMPKAAVQKDVMLPNGASYLMGMHPTMTKANAKKWFGIIPPDLSHMVRYKSAPWIYKYLTGFYWDPSRPSGWNNHMFPKVAMPNVLAPWGGIVTKKGKVLKAGRESTKAFDHQVAEIVAFLRFASDPSVFTRWALGPYVLAVLFVFTVFAYWLKREYWKDVHAKDHSEGKKS